VSKALCNHLAVLNSFIWQYPNIQEETSDHLGWDSGDEDDDEDNDTHEDGPPPIAVWRSNLVALSYHYNVSLGSLGSGLQRNIVSQIVKYCYVMMQTAHVYSQDI